MNAFADKRGTANWVQCPACHEWFHVSAALLGVHERAVVHLSLPVPATALGSKGESSSPQSGAALHCPHCHREFQATEAQRIVRGG